MRLSLFVCVCVVSAAAEYVCVVHSGQEAQNQETINYKPTWKFVLHYNFKYLFIETSNRIIYECQGWDTVLYYGFAIESTY